MYGVLLPPDLIFESDRRNEVMARAVQNGVYMTAYDFRLFPALCLSSPIPLTSFTFFNLKKKTKIWYEARTRFSAKLVKYFSICFMRGFFTIYLKISSFPCFKVY